MSESLLSQDEINALLQEQNKSESDYEELTLQQIDALGEIGNISMGTAATTLNTLLSQKVTITTPKVDVIPWTEFVNIAQQDLISISVDYVEGLTGICVMMLKEQDVKIITDLMFGGDGKGQFVNEEINEIHLSAISEAMNQMIGSASTSMAQLFNKKIDISTPTAIKADANLDSLYEKLGQPKHLVRVSFNMVVDNKIINSELMQVLPIQFAKDLISPLMEIELDEESAALIEQDSNPIDKSNEIMSNASTEPISVPKSNYYQEEVHHTASQPSYGHSSVARGVPVQQVSFPAFEESVGAYFKNENLDLLEDVSLEVTVELGRTTKKIKEVLDFGKGSVIELDRLEGEPVDVLVNGKFIAKGEVVVIDENFGIRITDINHTQK